jgi:hypothetical protein
MGKLVFLPAGTIVFLCGDYVHSAGLVDDGRGNAYGQLLIHVNQPIGRHSQYPAKIELDPRFTHNLLVAEHSLQDETILYNAIEL